LLLPDMLLCLVLSSLPRPNLCFSTDIAGKYVIAEVFVEFVESVFSDVLVCV